MGVIGGLLMGEFDGVVERRFVLWDLGELVMVWMFLAGDQWRVR